MARRVAAAACVGLAAFTAMGALVPDRPGGVPVLVAARDVQIGARIAPEDVRVEQRAADVVPRGAFSAVSQAQDRVTAAPLVAGEAIVPVRLVGSELLTALGPDRVAVALPVGDGGLLGVLAAGQRVDVFVPGTGTRVASAWVVRVTGHTDTGAFGAPTSPHLVVAVTRPEAAAIAAARHGLDSGFLVALAGGV